MFGVPLVGNIWSAGSQTGTSVPGVGLAPGECLLLEKADFKDKSCFDSYHPMCEAACPKGESISLPTKVTSNDKSHIFYQMGVRRRLCQWWISVLPTRLRAERLSKNRRCVLTRCQSFESESPSSTRVYTIHGSTESRASGFNDLDHNQ